MFEVSTIMDHLFEIVGMKYLRLKSNQSIEIKFEWKHSIEMKSILSVRQEKPSDILEEEAECDDPRYRIQNTRYRHSKLVEPSDIASIHSNRIQIVISSSFVELLNQINQIKSIN